MGLFSSEVGREQSRRYEILYSVSKRFFSVNNCALTIEASEREISYREIISVEVRIQLSTWDK